MWKMLFVLMTGLFTATGTYAIDIRLNLATKIWVKEQMESHVSAGTHDGAAHKEDVVAAFDELKNRISGMDNSLKEIERLLWSYSTRFDEHDNHHGDD